MCEREYGYATRFFAVDEKERIATHKYTAGFHEVDGSCFRVSQSAGRCSLHRFPKTHCAFWLPFGVVRNLVQEFRFRFCEEASSTHPPVIFLAFAKTSSAGMRLASPRS